MGTVGDQAPHQPSAQRPRRPHRDDHPRQPAPADADADAKADRLVYLGADQDGTLLEVMVIETDRGLLVIHAMPMRDKYRPYLDPEAGEHDAQSPL